MDLHQSLADGQGEDGGTEDRRLEQGGLPAGHRDARARQPDPAAEDRRRAAELVEESGETGLDWRWLGR